jgi:iron-sulfur cluster assembly protein
MLGSMKKQDLYCIFTLLFRQNLYNNMIKVSETAKKKVIELMSDDGYDTATDFVRVGVKSGGCSGLSYDLKFDKEQKEEDKVFVDNGVKIIIDKKSFLYLIGTTLEYSGGLNGAGFVFNNPNANRTCGCGESFSL